MTTFRAITESVHLLEVPFPGCWTGVTLVTGDVTILVDSGGMAETIDSCLVPALAERGMRLDDIDWVVPTHIHGDHVGGIARIRELAPSVRLAVFSESAERIREPLAYSRQIRARFPEHSPAAPAALRGAVPDLLLDDGDMLGSLQLLHTPGHDTDSCSFLESGTGALITGDSLQLNGTVSQGCALLFDPDRYRDSLERLLRLPVRAIVCGHPYLPLGEVALGEEASTLYLAACLAAFAHDEGFVRGMSAAGCDDVLTIAQQLVDAVGGRRPEHMFLPMHTVAALLARDADEGMATCGPH